MNPTRPKPLHHHASHLHQSLQHRLHNFSRKPKPPCRLQRSKRSMCPRKPSQQIHHRLRRHTQKSTSATPEATAHPTHPDTEPHPPPRSASSPAIPTSSTRRAFISRATLSATSSKAQRSRNSSCVNPNSQQQIMHPIHRPDLVLRDQPLQLFFGFLNRPKIQQLPKIGIAHQLPQLILIDRKRLRPPLRQRSIPVIDVAFAT